MTLRACRFDMLDQTSGLVLSGLLGYVGCVYCLIPTQRFQVRRADCLRFSCLSQHSFEHCDFSIKKNTSHDKHHARTLLTAVGSLALC